MATPRQVQYVRNLFGKYARLQREYEEMDSYNPFKLLKRREVWAAAKECKKYKPNMDISQYMEVRNAGL